MKKILFTLFITLIAFSSCRRFPVDPNNPGESRLAGTSWQLFAVNDAAGYREVRDFGPHTINFSASTADGQAEVKKYTANYRADGKNISFSNIVARGPETAQRSINDIFFHALKTAKTYIRHENFLNIESEGGVLYFEQISPYEKIHVLDMSVVDIRQDPCTILSAKKLEKNLLELTVQYSGGCAKHEFHLLADENIRPGNATDFAQAFLTHNSNHDACEAFITEKIIFDMTPLISRWKSYPHHNQRLVVNFNPQISSGIVEYTE